MNRTTKFAALTVVLGLAVAGAIPALAQNNEPATSTSFACPYQDQTRMTSQDMEQWMDSTTHDEWMGSADHDQMHAWMGDMDGMMGSGDMMGGMMGPGNMMRFSG